MAQAIANVFDAYANEANDEEIVKVEYNSNRNYVYLELYNGVSICSILEGYLQYMVTDTFDGEEYFFDNYDEALERQGQFE